MNEILDDFSDDREAWIAACRLTIPMRLEHHGDTPDHLYLTCRHTGLMVEVLDLPIEGDALPAAMPLRRVDAEGLGLNADDFIEGVVVCHDPHDGRSDIPHSGWACANVILIGVDDERPPVLLADAPAAATWLAAA